MSEATPPDRDRLQDLSNPDMIVWPLTYTESDSGGGNALARLSGGPRITPGGFRANGYDTRLALSSLPAWLAGGAAVSLHAIVSVEAPARSSRDIIVSLCQASADQPKLELAVVADPSNPALGCVAFRSYAGALVRNYLNRAGWRFEFRAPELVGGVLPSFQALLWIDATTLLLTAHVNDTKCILYRVDVTTGEYTGRASSTTYRHIGSLARNAAGEVWATDNYSGGAGYSAFRLDLAASFSTGEITADASSAQSGLAANGGLAFATVSGVEYALLQEYATSGTPHLYVFQSSALGSTLVASSRTKRFALGLRIQDVCVRPSDGRLYASRNIDQALSATSGWIQSYDVETAITSVADGAALSPVATEPAPSQYAEGVDFDPQTDRLWSCTEGLSAVSDQRSHVAVWSSEFPQLPESQSYLIDFTGGSVEVRVNKRLAVDLPGHVPTAAPARLAVGAPPSASAGLASGFMAAGTVRALAVKSQPFTGLELLDLDLGPDTELVETKLTLTNPGAEAGSAAGWTDELVGTTGMRNANPAPAAGSGSWYFVGGNSANGRARQRVSVSSGLTDPWVLVEWQQASYDGASDPGGVGVRALDSSGTELGYYPAPEVIVTPAQVWRYRSWSASLPAGTAQVDIVQHRTRTAGVNVDCYIDDIRATVFSR